MTLLIQRVVRPLGKGDFMSKLEELLQLKSEAQELKQNLRRLSSIRQASTFPSLHQRLRHILIAKSKRR